MFWSEDKKPDNNEKPETVMNKFFRACLLALLGVFALWLAAQLLSQFWGWLLLILGVVGLIWGVVWFVRWQQRKQW